MASTTFHLVSLSLAVVSHRVNAVAFFQQHVVKSPGMQLEGHQLQEGLLTSLHEGLVDFPSSSADAYSTSSPWNSHDEQVFPEVYDLMPLASTMLGQLSSPLQVLTAEDGDVKHEQAIYSMRAIFEQNLQKLDAEIDETQNAVGKLRAEVDDLSKSNQNVLRTARGLAKDMGKMRTANGASVDTSYRSALEFLNDDRILHDGEPDDALDSEPIVPRSNRSLALEIHDLASDGKTSFSCLKHNYTRLLTDGRERQDALTAELSKLQAARIEKTNENEHMQAIVELLQKLRHSMQVMESSNGSNAPSTDLAKDITDLKQHAQVLIDQLAKPSKVKDETVEKPKAEAESKQVEKPKAEPASAKTPESQPANEVVSHSWIFKIWSAISKLTR